MTLLERCSTIGTLLQKLEIARQERDLASKLNERAKELEEVADPFVNAMSSFHALCDQRIIRHSEMPDSSKAAGRVAEMRKVLAENPQNITKGRDFTLLRQSIGKLTDKCGELSAEAWKEYVNEQAPKVEKNVLNQFRDLPQYEHTVARIDELVGDLRWAERKAPADAEILHSIEEKWEELRECLAKLPVTEDPEVQAFLNAAISAEGAELDLLTPNVREYLDEHEMLADFCIRRSR